MGTWQDGKAGHWGSLLAPAGCVQAVRMGRGELDGRVGQLQALCRRGNLRMRNPQIAADPGALHSTGPPPHQRTKARAPTLAAGMCLGWKKPRAASRFMPTHVNTCAGGAAGARRVSRGEGALLCSTCKHARATLPSSGWAAAQQAALPAPPAPTVWMSVSANTNLKL